jgi:hypothetical protein
VEIATGPVGDQQTHVISFAVELDQLDVEVSAHCSDGVLAEVSISPVNNGRRYLVTNTRCACGADMLWRARR